MHTTFTEVLTSGDSKVLLQGNSYHTLMANIRVLIKCRQPAKKPATWRLEPSTFGGNRVKLESESLKLPTASSVTKPPTLTS